MNLKCLVHVQVLLTKTNNNQMTKTYLHFSRKTQTKLKSGARFSAAFDQTVDICEIMKMPLLDIRNYVLIQRLRRRHFVTESQNNVQSAEVTNETKPGPE